MKELRKVLTVLAITGNIMFMLWITYNGIHERFAGTIYEKLSYIGLMGLLLINTFLILKSNKGS